MRVLRRFPVSDEFISDRKTFCTILDRKEIYEIFNNGFFEVGHVTTERMEMSEIALRIEWKDFRIPEGPAYGRNCPLKSRNLGFGHNGTFFGSFRKFEKWEVPKKMFPVQSELFLAVWNRSGANRCPGGRAMSGKRPSPPRKPRVLDICFPGYPIFDLAIFGLYGPRICTAQRGRMALGDSSTLGYPGTLRGIPAVSGLNQALTCQ